VAQSCFERVFEMLDSDHSGMIEYREFVKAFGPAISGSAESTGLNFG
jgi:Ca2+-binding EF-hand superfamily protein